MGLNMFVGTPVIEITPRRGGVHRSEDSGGVKVKKGKAVGVPGWGQLPLRAADSVSSKIVVVPLGGSDV